MSSIVETFFGEYIDLDKIVSISKAEFIDRMGHGGYFVGFKIRCQLIKEPIVYRRELERDEYQYETGKGHRIVYGKDSYTPLAVVRLQKQVDELVQQWKNNKKNQ